MSIDSRRQMTAAKEKLAELEELYAFKQKEPSSRVLELTLQSLRKRINQFKEEIARFESRAKTNTESAEGNLSS